jgi:hypothetical protein
LYNWQSLFCQGIEERETNTLTISAGDDGIVSLDITENKTREAMLLLCAPVCVIHNEAASSHPAASSVFLFFLFFCFVAWSALVRLRRGGCSHASSAPENSITYEVHQEKKRKERKKKKKKCKVIGCNPRISKEIRKGPANSSGILEIKTNKNMTLVLLYYSRKEPAAGG